MVTIKDLCIEKFRGLKNLKLDNLKNINIIIGENNTGKTTVLEAIEALGEAGDIEGLIRVGTQRERLIKPIFRYGRLMPYQAFINLFNVLDKNKSLSIRSNIKQSSINVSVYGEEQKILKVIEKEDKVFEVDKTCDNEKEKIEISEIMAFTGKHSVEINGELEVENFTIDEDLRRISIRNKNKYKLIENIRYISPIEHYVGSISLIRLGDAIKSGYKNEIINMLKIFDENIISYELISEEIGVIPYLQHKILGYMPLSNFGDGVKKALVIASTIVSMEEGILLIDEIETAIHKDALQNFTNWILKVCDERNIQIFFTTHSIEAIDTILEGLNKNLEKVACYRLEKDEEDIFAKRFSGEKLYDIRSKMGLDIR